jgi:hypothetical protein
MGLVRVGIAIFLTALALAPAAQAARFAAPEGTGPEPCTQALPCSLKDAITKAKASDEVIVMAGTYTPTEALRTPEGAPNLDIHGDTSGPMPTIITSTASAWAFEFRAAGGRLSYLAVEETAPAFAWGVNCTSGGRVERVRVSATGNPAIGLLQGEDCTLRDSLVLAEGSNAQAILATGGSGNHAGIARNVTAVGTGSESTGITSSYSGGMVLGSYTLDARNVIASGGAWDLRTGGGAFGVGHFVISNSNFDSTKFEPASTISGASNQTTPPLFVNAAGGDYREAAGSPTIDAGAADAQIGSLDLAGNPRSLGAAPDIGAFEVVPPAISSPPPASGQIQSLSVTPRKFRAARAGEAILSAKKKAKAPVGATVAYSLTAAGTVTFSLERRLPGRKVGKRCVKQTRANKTKKRCSRFKPVKGSFTHSGQAGSNSFKFSGRLNGKGLEPGGYRLVGKTGSLSKTASLTIVK